MIGKQAMRVPIAPIATIARCELSPVNDVIAIEPEYMFVLLVVQPAKIRNRHIHICQNIPPNCVNAVIISGASDFIAI